MDVLQRLGTFLSEYSLGVDFHLERLEIRKYL